MRCPPIALALLLVGCPQDPAPLGNTAPSAAISSPAPGTTTWAGDDLTVTGGIADAETATASLTVNWSSSLDGDLGSGTRDGSGGVAVEFVPATAGEHALTLTVTDAEGASATASVAVNVIANTAPTIVIQAPSGDTDWLTTDTVELRALVTDSTHDVDELTVSVTSSLGGPLTGVSAPDADGIATWAGTLAAGAHTLTARVEDARGLQAEDTVTINVSTPAFAPTCSVAVPGLGVYNDTDAIPLMGQVGDTEDAPETLDIHWASSIDGTVNTAPASSIGELNGTATGLTPGNHVFTLTVTDSSGLQCTNSDLQLEINGSPSAPVLTITPASPSTDDDLTLVIVTPASDPENDPLTTTITWLRDGIAQAAWAGQTIVLAADTFSLETWTVEVEVSDGMATVAASPASVTIGNGAPSITAPIIGTAPLYTDSVATCTAGATSDPENDPVTVLTSWEVDGAFVSASGTTLDGATWFEKDQTVACFTTPTDGVNNGAAIGSVVLTVQNSTPSPPQISISPTTPSPSVGLLCLIDVAATDPDASDVAGLILDYTWFVGGSPAGITDALVPSSATAAGEIWTCEVTAEDSDGAVSTASSTSVTICTPETWYEDFDGDGFGNANVSQSVCPAPTSGWVQDNTDCNDNDITIFPFAGDSVGGPDEDCDGEEDCEAGFYLGTYFALCLPPGNGSWASADVECQNQGYDGLASIRTQLEQDYVWALFQATGQQAYQGVWIGLTDEIVEGSFGWLDGAPVTYTNWAANEPNNAGDEDCTHLNFPLGTGQWNDNQCTTSLGGYLCQLR